MSWTGKFVATMFITAGLLYAGYKLRDYTGPMFDRVEHGMAKQYERLKDDFGALTEGQGAEHQDITDRMKEGE